MTHIVGSLILGWLLADLLTGIFHWWEDRYGREEWPIIGPWIIAPNKLHHAAPLAFIEGGFWGRNRASITASLVVGLAWVSLAGPSILMVATLLGGALSNEVHRYAHQPSSAGPIIRILQQTGVLQSPKGHAAHHRPPQDTQFCVLTDWLNPTLEALGFWRRLERIFSKG